MWLFLWKRVDTKMFLRHRWHFMQVSGNKQQFVREWTINMTHESWGSVCVWRGVLRKSDQMLEVDIMLPEEGLFAPLSGSWMLDTTLYSLPPWSNTCLTFHLVSPETYMNIHSDDSLPGRWSQRRIKYHPKFHWKKNTRSSLWWSFFNIHYIA